ncbi:flagellar hook capping FlgD N-terminal domain-containing protein [Aliiroseovarius sp. F20344]|uniref:flagellar hook capping FlgD N-terminal domain-containing protein n=1 Tax=Aliiroseovarius sp. F20344 TaxID=2926414 RepID=UPI001FF68413|nr:flagellar hook capping FlgD N-terminal domain-containing protein [Aliiroseovarius sp. F20344]MCK0141205.1 flagellar hook assembly protein FlgD [Aliiroseovarius sp. F20344]
MNVTSTAMPAALTAAPADYAQASASDGPMVSSDFETFLVMLTAQMENQDPLNPIESTDYAVQLATFSGVEQQVRTNDLLKNMGVQLGLMGMSDIADWVGKEARVAAPVQFDGAPITLSPNPVAASDEAILVVKNAEGVIVESKPLPVSTEPVEWDGLDEYGNRFPDGVYSFELTSRSNGLHLSTDPVESYGRIVETQNNGGKLWLVLESGERVTADAVSALREAAE